MPGPFRRVIRPEQSDELVARESALTGEAQSGKQPNQSPLRRVPIERRSFIVVEDSLTQSLEPQRLTRFEPELRFA